MTNGRPEAFPQIAAVETTAHGESAPGLDHVQDFLRRFGYLPPSAAMASGVVDDETSDALRKYQEFHGLAATGDFDEATRAQMTRARCAMPDMSSGVAFATTCPWRQTEITYAFDVGTNDVGGDAEFAAVRAAWATWRAVVPLTFREVGTTENPNVLVGWRPAADPDLDMRGGTLAHADFPPDCGVVTNTLPKPVHFDDEEHTWSNGAVPGAFDIETVALHEIGHILGLAHSNVNGAVMFPTIGSNTTVRRLTQDDISGVQALYGAPQPPPPQPGRRCIVATAAYGSPLAPEVQFLRGIRDDVLRDMDWGRRFFDELERYYYRVSPAIADEMERDPDVRRIVRFAIVEPWTNYMRLLVDRPDWDRVDFDALEPGLREFLKRMRQDMETYLARIDVPDSFGGTDPAEAVKELNVVLNYVRRSGGAQWLDELSARGELPLRYAPEREPELATALRRGGRTDVEVARILHG